jgi:hypothetical protein
MKITSTVSVISLLVIASLHAMQKQTFTPLKQAGKPGINFKANYSYAGILPLVKLKGKTYVVLEKVPTTKKINLYTDVGGKVGIVDLNNPQATAARHFAKRTDIPYKTVLELLAKQCATTLCDLKSINNQYGVFPLEVTISHFSAFKVPYTLVSLENLEKAASGAAKSKQFNKVEVEAQDNSTIMLGKGLIQALADNGTRFFTYFAQK